ncbi:MAG: hypothetical protein HDS51_05715 [Barnesiella sp.]|nr:hypothetical protein [Barnesiella sp.]
MMRLPVILLAMLSVSSAPAAEPTPSAIDEAVSRLSSLPLHPIEGLWQMPGHESVVEIVRDSVSPSGEVARYRIEAIVSVDLAVTPGTVVGTVTPTAAYGIYDSRIFTDAEGDRRLIPTSPRRCTITLDNDESRLVARRYGRNIALRWWRLLPYMFRWAVSVNSQNAPDTDGLVRIYPETSSPGVPVYL